MSNDAQGNPVWMVMVGDRIVLRHAFKYQAERMFRDLSGCLKNVQLYHLWGDNR